MTRGRNCEDEIELNAVLVEDALQALTEGAAERHDALLAVAAEDLAAGCDVVIFAQASMARAAPSVAEPFQAKILTSPVTAIRKAGRVLAQCAG